MSEKINPSFSFDKDSLIIVFDKIITYQTEKVNPESLPDNFDVEEDVYQLTIKQEGSDGKHTVTYAIESILNEFKSEFSKYLNYKLKNAEAKNEYSAKILSDTQNFFEGLQSQVTQTLEEVTAKSENHLNECTNQAGKIFEENKVVNNKLNQELDKLQSLKESIEQFVLEEEDVSLEGELVKPESVLSEKVEEVVS